MNALTAYKNRNRRPIQVRYIKSEYKAIWAHMPNKRMSWYWKWEA